MSAAPASAIGSALVTGADGFTGAWLARALLEAGARVTALDCRDPASSALALHGIDGEVEVVRGEVQDPAAVARALDAGAADSVFHLAAQTLVGPAREHPAATFEANVRGTWTLLEACRARETARVVVASSDKAYGPSETLPYREDDPLRASFPYDASKAAADIIARSYWHTYGLPVAVTRFANIYGGGDLNFSRLIPEAVAAVLRGRSPVLRSDGTPERDFLYVSDAADAYLAIAAGLEEGTARGHAYNAGGGHPHAVAEVVRLVCEIAGAEFEPEVLGAGGAPAGEIDRQYVDPAKLAGELGWRPRVELREGLERTVEWYRAHPELLPVESVDAQRVGA